jgi:hypothetical protein
VREYWSGEPLNPSSDFDFACNGYPLGARVPSAWLERREHFYDTGRPGLSNQGHDEGLFLKDGREIFSSDNKRDLIQFLQTL